MATKIRRTLFIGLGGTGMTALLHTKRMLYDTYGEIPPMIGFLGIDTDGGVYNRSLTARDGTEISLSVSEQMPICVQQPSLTYQRSRNAFDWLPQPNASALTDLNIGAGQVRSNGRFAITMHQTDLEQRIQNQLRQINSAIHIDNTKYSLLSDEVEVHMVFSLSGGTGCGTFLNVAYLVRKLIPKVKISGYAVMADVFRAMMQGAAVVRVRPNAMGAIRDLDYLMHLDVNSTPVELKWLQGTEHINERPFTAIYLIDNVNTNNDTYSDVDQLAEMISLALVTTIGELSVAAASVSDNVAKVIGSGDMDICDKKAWVSSFGVSEIVFDGAALGAIYALKARIQLISMMLNGGCDDPSVIANAWFDNQKIRENNDRDDVIDYFMKATPERPLTGLNTPENPLQECDHYINNIAQPKQEALDAKLEDLKTRVADALQALMTQQINRECGVYLCENILNSIKLQLELCDDEMKQEIDDLRTQLPRATSALESVCAELKECMGTWLKRGKNALIEDVCSAAVAKATKMREIKRREMARLFYNWLRTSLSYFYDRVNTVMRSLQAVRDDSTARIEAITQGLGRASFFQFDLASAEAATITCPVGDIVFDDFIKSMKPEGGLGSFVELTADQAGERLLRFCAALPKAKSYADKTVEDVLAGMTHEQLLSIISRAIRKSYPLLNYSYRGFDAEVHCQPMDTYYIGVGDAATTILRKDDMLQNLIPGQKTIDFASIGITDRIIIYRQMGVLPAFTIAALDNYIPEYEKFEKDKPGTSHWDANLYRRMLKERFSLEPSGPKPDVLPLWVMAIVTGLISRDASGQYLIKSKGLGGAPLKGFKVAMGTTRPAAYDFFSDNIDVIKPELDAHIAALDQPGPANMLRPIIESATAAANDGSYLSKISLSEISADYIDQYPDDYELINQEINYILSL